MINLIKLLTVGVISFNCLISFAGPNPKKEIRYTDNVGVLPGWAYGADPSTQLICFANASKDEKLIELVLIRGQQPAGVYPTRIVGKRTKVAHFKNYKDSPLFKNIDQVYCTEYKADESNNRAIYNYEIEGKVQSKSKVLEIRSDRSFYLSSYKTDTPKGGAYFKVADRLFYKDYLKSHFVEVREFKCLSNISISADHNAVLIFEGSGECGLSSLTKTVFLRNGKLHWSKKAASNHAFHMDPNDTSHLSADGSRVLLGSCQNEEGFECCDIFNVYDTSGKAILSKKDLDLREQIISPNGKYLSLHIGEPVHRIEVYDIDSKKSLFLGKERADLIVYGMDDGGLEVIKADDGPGKHTIVWSSSKKK